MAKPIKILFAIIFLYFLTLLQTTFLVHFNISGIVINFVLILIILWNIFEDSKDYSGLFVAIIGGFYLDVFSNVIMGFNILILAIIAVSIKLIFRKHVHFPFIEKV